MGQKYQALCNDCGHTFHVMEGGGFFFHQLHCDKCGRAKSISFKKIGVLHMRYLKKLTGPYSVVTAESDKRIKNSYMGPAISEEEYHAEVEKMAGKCLCRGQYRFDAPPRCPKCRSTSLKEDPNVPGLCYD